MKIINEININYNSLELLFNEGLPKNIDTKALIAVNVPNISYEQKLYYQEFEKNKKNNKYNIPIYNEKIQEGFSIFCTLSEENSIKKYYDEESSDTNLITQNLIEDEIDVEIEPKGKYCQLCKKKFLIYSVHSKSKEHIKLMKEEYIKFQCISISFKRICNYYNEYLNYDSSFSNSSSSYFNSCSSNNFSTNDSIVDNIINDLSNYNEQHFFLGKKKNDIYNQIIDS